MRKIDALELVSKRPFAGRIRGEHRSVRKGHSLEFADYRSYIQGDDIRHIDWKIFARLDRLFLKLFMEEEDLFVYFLVDASHSMGMGEPAKLAFAQRAAAAIGYISLACTHRVAVYPYASDLLEPLEPVRGRGQYPLVHDYLATIEPEGSTATRNAVAKFRQRLHGSGVVFVMSDLFDRAGVEEALKPLLAGRFEVVVLHVLSPEDEDPAWDGDWQLVDVEDGEKVSIAMSDRMREAYAKTVRQFRAEQQKTCQRYGFDYVPVRSDVPLESVLLHSLRSRGVLR
jgi:uncharacterized protein (DUF58 family)